MTRDVFLTSFTTWGGTVALGIPLLRLDTLDTECRVALVPFATKENILPYLFLPEGERVSYDNFIIDFIIFHQNNKMLLKFFSQDLCVCVCVCVYEKISMLS